MPVFNPVVSNKENSRVKILCCLVICPVITAMFRTVFVILPFHPIVCLLIKAYVCDFLFLSFTFTDC